MAAIKMAQPFKNQTKGSGFLMVSPFQSPIILKTGPFHFQTTLYHSNSGQVRFSNGDSMLKIIG
jgi:hypothetical protein